MTDRVDPDRLKAAMARKGMSLKALSRAASAGTDRVSERTISRLLSGKHAGGARPRTIVAIANALGIASGILTGDLQPPEADPPPSLFNPEGRWSLRVPTAIRNAYALVASYYGVPAARIVEQAPLLFLLAAEQSLAARREHLAKLQTAYAARSELWRYVSHLPVRACSDSVALAAYDAEAASISKRDIFGDAIMNDPHLQSATFIADWDDDQDQPNPYATFLTALAATLQAPVDIEDVSLTGTRYAPCRTIALQLAGGDAALAEEILTGAIPLHELPSDLRRGGGEAQRLVWLREQSAAYREKLRRTLNEDVLGLAILAETLPS